MPLKDIVWIAEGNVKSDNVYPLCGNTKCCRISHLAEITKDDCLRRQSCIGHVCFVIEKQVEIQLPQSYEMRIISEKALDSELDCLCTPECKKCYFHEYRSQSITSATDPELPFNLPDTIAPLSTEPVDRHSKKPAMRFTVEEAKALLDLCNWFHYINEMKCVADETRQLLTEWTKCAKARGNHIFIKGSGKGPKYAYLKIPKEDDGVRKDLYKIAREVKLKDLVWRANGHSIGQHTKIYNTCLVELCDRYDHLVEETSDEYVTRLSCGNILCFEEDKLNSIIPCKHNRKCRTVRDNFPFIVEFDE
jgi:hypothetical protein